MLRLKSSNFCLLLSSLISSLILLSCSNPVEESKQKSTVNELINSQPHLSTYKEAMAISGLNSYLEASNLTYFIPTNAAFQKFLSDNNYALLSDVPVLILKEILMNHLMNGLQLSSSLSTGYFTTLAKGSASATNNLSLFVSTASGSIVLNGISKIITSDVTASNGIIHIVDTVLILPSILAQLTANPVFTDLLVALTIQNQALPLNYFKNTLSDTTIKTFFAPTNAAFTSFNLEFGYTTTTTIAATLQNQILRYHIASGTNFALNSFINNQIITTNISTNLSIQFSTTSIENFIKLKDVNNRLASIIYKNIQCTNGMIHTIDKVLKP